MNVYSNWLSRIGLANKGEARKIGEILSIFYKINLDRLARGPSPLSAGHDLGVGRDIRSKLVPPH